jgi:hypothetical protein
VYVHPQSCAKFFDFAKHSDGIPPPNKRYLAAAQQWVAESTASKAAEKEALGAKGGILAHHNSITSHMHSAECCSGSTSSTIYL